MKSSATAAAIKTIHFCLLFMSSSFLYLDRLSGLGTPPGTRAGGRVEPSVKFRFTG
jgi:hypothetical protein